MKFSIIIPAYNVADYLEKCVKSVLIQEFKDYEILIINDGSTDATAIVADKLSVENTNKVRVLNQTNGGASKARNTGIESARGEYLLFLDGDDFWSDQHFLNQLDEITTECVDDVIVFGYSYFYDDRIIDFPISMFEENILKATCFGIFNGPNWNKCVSKKLFQNGLKFPEGMVSEDSLYCSRILKMTKKFSILNSTQYMYRQNRKGSLTNVVKEKNVQDTLEGIRMGLSDLKNYSVEIQKALNIYFAISFISILPYVNQYIDNFKIKELLYQYKYLLQYAKYIENRAFKLTGLVAKLFGIKFSIKLFPVLLKFYK